MHAIVAPTTERGTDGLLNTGPETYTEGGPLGWLIRHWLALPGGTYEVGSRNWFNFALVGLIALVLCLTLVKGWKRDVLIVPDGLARRVRLGDAPGARGVGPDAAAPARSDPGRADDRAAAGSPRRAAGGDRLMAERCSSSRA